ncbi:MAG TPA: ATP-binding protein [Candidatus Polarisedimenticolia bacterium]|nr:ATP-binding protein [Candidatus Polarisedimenticolia bacterium]
MRYSSDVNEARWRGIAWFTVLSIAAVVAINAAGFWSLAVARRGLREDAARLLNLETGERARGLEATLARTRGELAFMAGSPVLFDLESALGSRDPSLARWRRLEAEGAVLLFLRAHPEVMRAEVLGSGGQPLLEAARRGGVPVLWMTSGDAASPARRAIDPIERPVEGRFAPRLGTRSVRGAVTVEATIDAKRLLPTGGAAGARVCRLLDGAGNLLSGDEGASAGPSAQASLDAEGWSAPTPWRLECRESGAGAALALLDPLASRYRKTLFLNLAAMSLAVVLGGFAIHQARRRRDVEAQAREEARVRDLERKLFHAERLGTVGRLAAGMAHEINNPLEGMANYLALAKADLERGDVAAARRRLDGVQEGLNRVGSVVGQVLAHSDPARAPLAQVDLGATARQAAEFVRSRPEFAAVRFQFDLPEGLPRVAGRQTLLGQVFLNLVLNACEAQPDGGEVLVSGRATGAGVEVQVADRGPGVKGDDAVKVFEPFYSTKGSTGLGLSTCYAIVEQHRGVIEMEPRPGGGTIFKVRLPAEVAAESKRASGAVAEGGRG